MKKRRIIKTFSGLHLVAFNDVLELATYAIDKNGALVETVSTPEGRVALNRR